MTTTETRRNTNRAVMSVAPVASLAETEQWKLGGGTPGGKRKNDNNSTASNKKAKEQQSEPVK